MKNALQTDPALLYLSGIFQKIPKKRALRFFADSTATNLASQLKVSKDEKWWRPNTYSDIVCSAGIPILRMVVSLHREQCHSDDAKKVLRDAGVHVVDKDNMTDLFGHGSGARAIKSYAKKLAESEF